MKKGRVLVIGSSMSLPRKEVHYNETWVCKLIDTFPNINFIDKCRRGPTSERLVSEGAGAGDKNRSADLLEYYSPDIIITQMGMTDCAPRLYRRGGYLSYLFHVLPNKMIIPIVNLLKKYRGRKEKFAYVSPKDFEQNWEQYIQRCEKNGVSVISILIGMPAKIFLSKSPDILKAVNKYNAILIKLSQKYNNMYTLTPYTQEEVETCALDEYHVDAKGHDILFEKLKILLEEKYFKKLI